MSRSGGVKLGSHINVLKGRVVVFELFYSLPHPLTGESLPANPVNILATIALPNGQEWVFEYWEGDDDTNTIEKIGDGAYRFSFEPPVSGEYQYTIVTNGGGGSGENGRFRIW